MDIPGRRPMSLNITASFFMASLVATFTLFRGFCRVLGIDLVGSSGRITLWEKGRE